MSLAAPKGGAQDSLRNEEKGATSHFWEAYKPSGGGGGGPF